MSHLLHKGHFEMLLWLWPKARKLHCGSGKIGKWRQNMRMVQCQKDLLISIVLQDSPNILPLAFIKSWQSVKILISEVRIMYNVMSTINSHEFVPWCRKISCRIQRTINMWRQGRNYFYISWGFVACHSPPPPIQNALSSTPQDLWNGLTARELVFLQFFTQGSNYLIDRYFLQTLPTNNSVKQLSTVAHWWGTPKWTWSFIRSYDHHKFDTCINVITQSMSCALECSFKLVIITQQDYKFIRRPVNFLRKKFRRWFNDAPRRVSFRQYSWHDNVWVGLAGTEDEKTTFNFTFLAQFEPKNSFWIVGHFTKAITSQTTLLCPKQSIPVSLSCPTTSNGQSSTFISSREEHFLSSLTRFTPE